MSKERCPDACVGALGPLGCWVEDLTVVEGSGGNLRSPSKLHCSVWEETETHLSK